jgi:hypothetical protein
MPDYIVPEELLKRLLNEAAQTAVKQFDLEHPCRLSPEERGVVHSLHEAMVEEGANHGTIRIIIQMGKSFQDVTKSFRRAGMVILILSVFVLLALVFGQDVAMKVFK